MKQLDSPELYTIGWIAALHIERAAATALLDECHETPEGFDQHVSDENSYTWGRIGKHNVVIASLPDGVYGTTSAATTVSDLVSSLPHIRIGLLVGIGGGIAQPNRGRDIRLGDIVVSRPEGTTGGVVQYGLGKVKQDDVWELKGYLNKPPQVLLNALGTLRAKHEVDGPAIPALLQAMYDAKPRMKGPKNNFTYQGFENDRLFYADYDHCGGTTCNACDNSQEIKRDDRNSTDPEIHYGIIASGNTLIKNATSRDIILEVVGEQCMCVEMEAAGLMDRFPCLVIRGICDYADSHKNDRWQRYASATAAAFAKELIQYIPVRQLEATQRVVDVVESHLKNIQLTLNNTDKKVQDVGEAMQSMDWKIVLSHLPIANGAAFDSRAEQHNPTCLVNTRVDLIQQIHDWANDPYAKPIFWLNGMAGTGKSTISYTIARDFAKAGYLGASFFFKRGEADRGGLSKFVTTIAAQLAHKVPDTATEIKAAVDSNPDISDKAARDQFDKLIMQPLGNTTWEHGPPDSLVFVVDALDECEGDEDVRLIINLFSHTKDLKLPKLRVFITSRPDLPVTLGFTAAEVKGTYQDLILHEVPPSIIEHDISAFLKHETAKIRSEYNSSVLENRRLSPDWPGEMNLQILVKMAIPLFVFAATVCRFVADRNCGSPDEQLNEVLQFQREGQASQLKATYLPVMNRLIKGLTSKQQDKAIRRFRIIVGSIVILASPLSTPCLSGILDMPQNIIDGRLDLLHSVLSIPSSDQSPVRLLHLSFRDFLIDSKKPAGKFWVDEKETHKHLAMHCRRVMSKGLKSDICELKQPGTKRAEIIAEHINSKLPPELQYACLYWVYHTQQAGTRIDDNGPEYEFLKEHFLHWLEALSFMGRASESLQVLKALQSILIHKKGKRVMDFLQDGLQFVQSNIPVLDSTPLQLYGSILAFTPKNSTIRQRFFGDNQVPQWISLAPEPENDWDQCQQVIEGHTASVNAVTFSPQGDIVASASYDQTVRLWRVSDGQCTQELKGHTSSVGAVTFSPQGDIVASASSDRTGDIVASASGDRTVRLWRVSDGQCTQELKGHTSSVNAVTFSPQGDIVASASDDDTVRLWRVSDGQCAQRIKSVSTSYLKFLDSGPLILTHSGSISTQVDPSTAGLITIPFINCASGLGISQNRFWISWYGKPLFWLPANFRPACSALSGSSVVIGCDSGRVIIMRFQP
ncbi:hypothetical protein ACQKWADRAFT_292337 [Trichoderma austrokoningii]